MCGVCASACVCVRKRERERDQQNKTESVIQSVSRIWVN